MMPKVYATVPTEYRFKTFEIMQEVKPQLEYQKPSGSGNYFALYLMVFERIDIHKGTFSIAEQILHSRWKLKKESRGSHRGV